jgi:hypothetical protein
VDEQDFLSSEGPIVITRRGNMVFAAESFPLDLARKLTALILDAQGAGELKMANAAQPGLTDIHPVSLEPLTGNLMLFFSNCGVMKSAVDAAMAGAESQKIKPSDPSLR